MKRLILFIASLAAVFGQGFRLNPITGQLDLVGGYTAPSGYSATVTAQTTTTVTAASHGQGTAPVAYCFDNASPANAVACAYTVSSIGDVVFTWSPAFTGTVIIRGPGADAGAAGNVVGPSSATNAALACFSGTTGKVIAGCSALSTAGAVPYVASAGVLTQDAAEFFWDAANNRLGLGTSTPTLGRIHVLNSTTDSGIFINQTGEYRALNILANGPATSLGQAVVDSQTATTGGVLWVGASGAGFTNTTTGASYHVVTNAAATGNVVMVRNYGLGKALNLKNDQNTQLMYLDAVNTTTDVIGGALPNLTTGGLFNIGTNNNGYTNSLGIIRVAVGGVSSTGNAIVADMSGSGTAFRANTSKGYGLDVQSSSSTASGARVFMTGQNNNDALQISIYNAPTGTGKALSVYGGINAGSLNAWINSVGDAYFGGTASSTYKLDIAASGSSGTLRVFNQSAGGSTMAVIQAGDTQGSVNLLSIRNNVGTEIGFVTGNGYALFSGVASSSSNLSNAKIAMGYASFADFRLSSDAYIAFNSATNVAGTLDAGIKRSAPGNVAITDGSSGLGRIVVAQTTPSASSDACTAGALWADASYVYACTASGTIKRATLNTF